MQCQFFIYVKFLRFVAGNFGCVYAATLRDSNLRNPFPVAVKTIEGKTYFYCHIFILCKLTQMTVGVPGLPSFYLLKDIVIYIYILIAIL